MYTNVSSEFDDLIGTSGRRFHARLVNGTNVINDVRSFSLYQASNGVDNIGIGGNIASYMECKIGTTELELEDVEYELQIGIHTSNNSIEYVPVGLFTPKKPSIQGEITSFIAYDRIKKLSAAYFSNIENYPVDSKMILEEISQMTGIPIDYSNLSNGVKISKRLLMRDVTVNDEGVEVTNDTYEKPFNGYTYQETIAYIAQLHAKFAQTNRKGSIIFKWFENAAKRITKSQYIGDTQLAEKEFVLGAIHCSTADGELICGAGGTGISIDNPVMTQGMLENVYNKIAGFKCRALTMNYNGDIRLDVGDVVTVDVEDGEQTVPIMKMETIYDGGIRQILYSFGDTAATESSKGPTAQRLDRMYSELLLIKEVMANKISADVLQARIAEMGYASIDELTAEVAKMGLMTAEEADIKYMTVQSADLKYASITSLEGVVAKFSELESHAITTENIEAKMAEMDYLKADEADIRYMTVQSADLKYASIDLSNIESGTITDAMIANGAIGTAHIADGSITDAKIVGLTANKITAGVLDAATIEVVNLNAANITVGTINGQQIASGAVSLDNLANDVTDRMASTEEEVAQAFEDAKKAILDSSTAINIISAWSYDDEEIYINGAAIYAGTIVSDKIAANAVTATKIEAGAIGTDKLAANAVTAAKIATGTITATQIKASTITGAKIASKTISADNIASSAITTEKLAATSITAAKIASSAITADKIAANAVTATKIDVGELSAISANLGTVTAGVIQSSNYTEDSNGEITNGMKLMLESGEWNSKYFTIESDGKIVSTGGLIGGWTIGDTQLKTTSYGKVDDALNSYTRVSMAKPGYIDADTDIFDNVFFVGYGEVSANQGGAGTDMSSFADSSFETLFAVDARGRVTLNAFELDESILKLCYKKQMGSFMRLYTGENALSPFGSTISYKTEYADNYSTHYGATDFCIRLSKAEDTGYTKTIEGWIGDGYDDTAFQLALHNYKDNKSIVLDGNDGIVIAEDVQTKSGISLNALKVDSAFSTTSTNPVQNKVITNWLNNNHAWKVRSVAFSALNTNISVSEFGTANEILIVVKAETTAYQYEFTIIPKLFGTGNLLGGYSIGTQYTGVCELYYNVPNKVIQIRNLRVGNNAYTSGTVFVFYR